MDDDMAEFFTDSSNYLESLVKCRQLLKDAPALLTKLDDVLSLELDLALAGAEKAMSEIIKANKSTVTPLKGV